MKNLVIILTFLFSLCGITTDTLAISSCNGLKVEPEVKLFTSFGQLSYDFNHNTQQITELGAAYNHQESSLFIHGLATLEINQDFSIGFKVYPLPDNKGYCIVPQVIELFVGFATPRIYISNELEPNTCRYNLVLLHERTHHRINIMTLKYFLPIFKRAAKKIGDEMQPMKIRSKSQKEEAENKFVREFHVQFEKVFAIFQKELAIEQGKLDNSINYSMEDKLCRDFNVKKQRSPKKFRQGNR